MTFLSLLLASSFILPVLAAFLWSARQAILATGTLRLAHAALVVLTLLGIAAMSYDIDYAGQFTGVFLGLAAAVAIWLEKGWARAFPIILLFLALMLILHLNLVTYA